MDTPLLSIIIPTYNRPHLLLRAVESALGQTVQDLEVIVVDDASTPPVELPSYPKLQVIHLPTSRGGAGARNVGTEAARGRWVTYLDDDDRLLPHMAAVSLAAIAQSSLPAPVAVISGMEVLNTKGEVTSVRLPPTCRPRGCHFFLEDLEPDRSYLTKQTLVVEANTIRHIGGWDESFCSRVHSELFLRLNPACTIIGIPEVTYQLYAHEGERVSRHPLLRQESFTQLVNKHRQLFDAHPKMFAQFVYSHARTSYQLDQQWAALLHWCWAMQIDPRYTLARTASLLQEKLQPYASENG